MRGWGREVKRRVHASGFRRVQQRRGDGRVATAYHKVAESGSEWKLGEKDEACRGYVSTHVLYVC